MKKRLLSLALAVVMVFSLLPMAAFAAAEEFPEEAPVMDGEEAIPASPAVIEDEMEEQPDELPDEQPEELPAELLATLEELKATEAEIAAMPLGNVVRPGTCDPKDTTTRVNATADSQEADSVVPSGAIDGGFTGNDRWSSATGDGAHWLQIDLGTQRAISVIKIYWERDNVIAYTVEGSQDGDNWVQLFEQTERYTGHTTRVIELDAPVKVQHLKISTTQHQREGTKYDGTSVSWNAVSVMEVEAFRDSAAVPPDVQEVVDAVTLSVEGNEVVMDTSAAEELMGDWDFDITLGANLEQVVGSDGTIHTPLVNTKVELSVFAERLFDGVRAYTNGATPIVLTIPGEHTTNMGNPKPRVIPEIMEWYSASAQKGQYYTLTSSSKIVAPAALNDVAAELQADVKDLFGFEPQIAASGEAARDIVLVLDTNKANQGFDDETYLMEVTDKVVITGSHATGVYWGTRSVLQALKLSGNQTIAQGTARDYPEFKVRGWVMDVGRKPVTMDTLNDMVKNMSWYKLNDFHVHVNDNLIGMENYKDQTGWKTNADGEYELDKNGNKIPVYEDWRTEDENGNKVVYQKADAAYSAFRLESDIEEEADARAPLTAKDYHYTKAEYQAFVEESAKLGVQIVTEIDVPAHAKAITDAFPSLQLFGCRGDNWTGYTHPYNDHLDLTNKYDQSLELTKTIFDEYLDDGIFGSAVHFGADEYYADGTPYRRFVKDMIQYLKNKKATDSKLADLTIRQWGSLTTMSSNAAGLTDDDLKNLAEGVQMNIWNTGWANPQQMYNMGFDLINVTDGPFYMVPNGGGGRGGYGDYLNLSDIYAKAPNQIGNTWFPASSSQILGSAYAMWGDSLLDVAASGLDEMDLFHRFYDALPVMAVRQWGEGEELDRTLSELQTDAAITGVAPQTDPFLSKNNAPVNYTFDDSTGLTLQNAQVENGVLTINGDASYAETGLDRLPWGSELTFTVNVTKAPTEKYGEVIIEGDRVAADSAFPYNEYAIKAMPVEGKTDKWKLVITRELYDYEFDTEFTVNTPVTLKLTTAKQSTKLSVDGGEAISPTGKMQAKQDSNIQFKGRTNVPHSSFELPVARFGSKTNPFTGTIDNVTTTSPEVEEPERPEEGTALVNLALNKSIVAQSSGEATVGNVTDGDVRHVNNNNYWIPDNMKSGVVENDTQQTEAWFVVDLGAEAQNLTAEEIVVSYEKQCWPTEYKIQTSESASGPWTDMVSVSRSVTENGWINNQTNENPVVHRQDSTDVNGVTVVNFDWIKDKQMTTSTLKRYVRFCAAKVQPKATEGNQVRVIEFMVFARLPETESAENIKAYQISGNEVRLSWDDDGYYQVYAKAPNGAWECVSGDEVVDGNVFIHDGYEDGMTYCVVTPASDAQYVFSGVTPVDVRPYDTDSAHYGWVDFAPSDRVTLGEGGWNPYGGGYNGVYYNNSSTANTTAEFVFVGSGIEVIGTQFTNGGNMTVFIDGEQMDEKMVGKAPGNSNVANAIQYRKTGLANGFHTIRLVADIGARVEIDAFRVLVPAQTVALSATGLENGALTITTSDATLTNVTATVSPVNGSGAFAWTSGDENIATISGETAPGLQGLMVATITPVAGGTATLKLMDGQREKAAIALTVKVSVTNVTLPDNQHSATLYLNPADGQSNTVTLDPTVMPEDASDKSVTWSTSNANVATVTGGVVTAVAPGTATITVTTVDGGKSTTCAVTVKSNPTAIAVKDGDTTVTEAEPVVIYNNKGLEGKRSSVTLTAELTPSAATETGMTWSRADGTTEGLITLETVSGEPTQQTISAVGQNERDVGEKVIEVKSTANPAISTTFKVRVVRQLVHDVTISVHEDAAVRPGAVLEADINQLNLDTAGVAGLTYQWLRDGAAIEGDAAKAKTYTLTNDDIGGVITVKVTATLSDTYFYEGERTSTNSVTVGKNAAPAAPALTATAVDGATKGTITITGAVAGAVYEISNDGGKTWTDATVTDGVIGDLDAGDYEIRLKATDTHEAGEAATITVTDATKTYFDVTFTATPAEGGTVVLSKTSAEAGTSVTATVTAKPGFTLKSVTVDGDELTGVEGVYTVESVSAAVEFVVTFEAIRPTITHVLTNGLSCNKSTTGQDSHQVDYGTVEVITIVAADGYSLPDRQGVQVTKTKDGAAFTGYDYDPETGVITITGGVTEDLTITATGVVTTYQIAHELNHVTCDLEDHTVAHKAALTIGLTADEGWVLPETITVTMGDTTLTAGTDYTYDKVKGELKFAAGKITGNLKITVVAERILTPLVSVSIEGSAQVGQRLEAKVNPEAAASYVNYQWFRVDENGDETAAGEPIEGATGMSRVITEASEGKKIIVKVTAVADSQYTGTVTSQATAVVIAADAPTVPVELVTLDKATASVEQGKTLELTATVRPANATNQTVTWTSDNEAVATVDSAGVVTAKAVGTANITVTTQDGEKTATCVVTVTQTETPRPSRPSTSTSSTSTTTKVEEDGTKITTVTKPDGSKTQTVEQPDGTKSELAVTKNGDVTITVTDENGEELVNAEIPATIPEPETKFEDVAEAAPWAEEAVNKMAGLELVKGTGGNKYSPIAPMTRGSLATVLHRLSQGKTDYENTFKDVAQGKYYTEGVAWAAKANVVKGVSEDIFAPEQTITREQLAVMMARYAKLVGLNTKADAETLEQFADAAETGTWAEQGVAWCVAKGILKGKGGNTLDPTAEVTRAEVAVMLDRFIELLK